MSAPDEFEEPAPTPTYNCKRCKKVSDLVTARSF